MSEFKYIESAYKAAKLEDPDAMLELANFFYNNQEFDEAYRNSEYSKWLGKSAAKDNIQALIQIGLSYYSGDGVDKNPRRGLRYLERCAALGDVTSLYHLGLFLILGGDIEADIPKGLQHIKNAAEKKDYKASILLNNIQRSYPNIPFEELDNEKLHTIAYNTLRDNDTFPTFPHLVRKGKLAPITGIKRGRPMFSLDGNTETGAKDEHPTFLAQKDFHKATIEITKIEYTTPFITTENGLIFTGNEGSVSFYAKPTEQIDNLFCVLAVRNGKRKADYDWEELGSLSPNKEKRIRFKIDISFKDPDEIALLFYSNGKEIVSNIRMQMNHFLDDNLSTFTKERIQYIIENSDTDVEPIMQNPISSYIFDYLHIAEGSKAYFDINEYGFVKAAHFSKEVEERTSNKILEILPYLTFYPRIKNGSPLPSKVAVPIE